MASLTILLILILVGTSSSRFIGTTKPGNCLLLLIFISIFNLNINVIENYHQILDESNEISSPRLHAYGIKPIPEVLLEIFGHIIGIMEIYQSITTFMWGPDEAAHLNEQFEKSSYQLEQINEYV